MTPARSLVSEGLGTALLLAVVIGSGIMGERLAGGNVAIALLANAIATGAGLVALILIRDERLGKSGERDVRTPAIKGFNRIMPAK